MHMTEPMTMNTVIHAAFRRDLRRFDTSLAAFPAGSQERAHALKAAWDFFSYQLHLHHEDEQEFFWPALRELGADESLVGDLHGEHTKMLSALEAADSSMAAFSRDPSAENAEAARAAIAGVRGVVEEHLEHEERDLEPFTVRNKSTPQLKAAAKSARKSHSEGGGTFFAWLSDGIDPDTARALREEVPAPVLFMLTRFGRRNYQRRIASAWT